MSIQNITKTIKYHINNKKCIDNIDCVMYIYLTNNKRCTKNNKIKRPILLDSCEEVREVALTEKESDELFQFLMEGAVRKLINCMVAEGNTEEEIVHELKRIQKEYKKENTPEGVIMTATEETLRKIVRAGQDYLRRALENNPSIADSVCRKTNYIH